MNSKKTYNHEILQIIQISNVLDSQIKYINETHFTVTMQCQKKVGQIPKIILNDLYQLILEIQANFDDLKQDVNQLKIDLTILKSDMALIKTLPTINKKELAIVNK